MDEQTLKRIFQEIKNGKITPDEALSQLKHLPYQDIGFAKVDHHRHLRQGFPEVIYCGNKTAKQIAGILKKISKVSGKVLATRLEPPAYAELKKLLPKAILKSASYQPEAHILTIGKPEKVAVGSALILTAGTADIPVAREAEETARFLGLKTESIFDAGVAGVHRLLKNLPALQKAKVIIVIAGMEGALASVVGGLVEIPVIAVPTSVGYGASFKGLSALLAMLNSCAAGVAVVNIDNGFGAAVLAWKMLKGAGK